MPKLLLKIEKDFVTNAWNVLMGNKTQNYLIELIESFEFTHPNPGAILAKKDIEILIEFLQQTLKEEDNEQSIVE